MFSLFDYVRHLDISEFLGVVVAPRQLAASG
jgi:hypothetical protein